MPFLIGVRSEAEIKKIVAEYTAVAKSIANTSDPSATLSNDATAPATEPPSLSDVRDALLVRAQAWQAEIAAGQLPTPDDADAFCADLSTASGIFRAAGDDGSADSLDGCAEVIDLVGLLQQNGDEVDLGGLKQYIDEFVEGLEGSATPSPASTGVTKAKPAVSTAKTRTTGWIRIQRAAPYRGSRPLIYVAKSKDKYGRTELPCCLASDVAAFRAQRTGEDINQIFDEMRKAGVSVDCRVP
jgi:hypothetical protein